MKRLAIALVACSCAAPSVAWRKLDSTHEDFLADKWECTRDSRTSWASTGGLLSRARARGEAEDESRRLFIMCMEAHGWRLVEQTR